VRLNVSRLSQWVFVVTMEVVVGLSHSRSAMAVASSCVTGQSVMRSRFPVVFKAPEWLWGARVDAIEGWSLQGKSWQKILIQVDEVNADGSYVLEQGIPYTKFTDDGLLDGVDEISVRGLDLGSPNAQSAFIKPPGQFIKMRRVDFCDNDGKFFGSLWLGLRATPVEQRAYAQMFDEKLAEVNTPTYRYQFRQGQPMLMGNVKLKTSSGEKPVFAGNSFIMPLLPRFFIFPSLYFGESDFTSEIECWRSGPIRSIVAVGARLRKFFSFLDLHLFSELVFYENYFQIPTKIEFVFDPSKYLAKGSGIAYVLQYPDGVDWRLKSTLKSLPISGPESDALKESAFDVAPDGAFAVRGESAMGSFVAQVRVDAKALKQSPPPYIASNGVFDHEPTTKAWPWLRKARGSLGVFIEISGVKRGVYDFALDLAVSNQADDGFGDFKTLIPYWSEPGSL
jgi:hypothetical protein